MSVHGARPSTYGPPYAHCKRCGVARPAEKFGPGEKCSDEATCEKVAEHIQRVERGFFIRKRGKKK